MKPWNVVEMKKTAIYKLLLLTIFSKKIASRQSKQYVFTLLIVQNVVILHNVHPHNNQNTIDLIIILYN
jgi:hypothetical protein